MNHFIFSALVTFFSTLVAGIYFVLKKKSTARIFGLYWLSIAFWSSTVAFQSHFLKLMPDYVWGWFLHLGCVYVPVFFFHFALYYSGYIKDELAALKISYAIATAFIFLNTFTPFFTHTTSYRDNYAYPRPAILYPLYFVFFVSIILWGTVLLFRSKRKLSIASRNRLLLFLILNILAYAGAMDNFLIMADIRIFPVYPFGLYLVPPYAIIGSYAVSRSLGRSG